MGPSAVAAVAKDHGVFAERKVKRKEKKGEGREKKIKKDEA